MPVAAIDTIAELLARLSSRSDEVRRAVARGTEGTG
jgi:hypothetical protein